MKFEKREFVSLPDIPNPISEAAISEAEVYYKYGQFRKAFNVLYDALSIMKDSRQRVIFTEYLSIAKHLYMITVKCYSHLCTEHPIHTIESVRKFIIEAVPIESSYRHLLEDMFHQVHCFYEVDDKELDKAVSKIIEKLDIVKPQKPPLKQQMIDRLIHLSKGTNLPGFDEPTKVHEKFINMPDDLFMTMFELIVIQAHRDGHQ